MTETLEDLVTPVAIVDLDRLEANIARMAERAREFGVNIRPHVKTHKCVEIGKMQERAGSSGITVSTLAEAETFADAGFRDITYAVPITRNKIGWASEIASRVTLNLLVDHLDSVEALSSYAGRERVEFNVLLKVDCGYHRCGINPDSMNAMRVAEAIAREPDLNFLGILTHAGHAYNAYDVEEIRHIARREQEVMVEFSKRLRDHGIEVETVSIGSTPTMALTESMMKDITEIRPGNYVFYDWTQVKLGSCVIDDCALTVLSSVVGQYEHHTVIDAGATALSKDLGATHITRGDGFGQIYLGYESGDLLDASILSLSQEHGKVRMRSSRKNRTMRPGDLLRILPNHSCLTANLHDHYYVVREGTVVDKWRVRHERSVQ
ncbi:MAG: alanine racemase [Candidatus Thorarchaeota archaeon]